jgi:Kef-type K+ transport system membrane component KefB
VTILLLIVLGALMQATRSFTEGDEPGSAGTSLAFGYLLISAHFGGQLARAINLPKLTGYLSVGLLVGPSALGLLSERMVESLTLVNGMAIALIALTAGIELDLRLMRPLLRFIAGITLVGVLGTALLLTAAVWLLRAHIPAFSELDQTQSIALSAVLGIVIVAQSPAVVVALRDELNAEGAVTRTALGVVIIADMLVILLFTLASTAAKAALGTGASVLTAFYGFAWELVGSIGAGVAVGALLSLYLQRVREGRALFLLAVTFVIAEVGGRLHLDPLITALSAGAFIRNMTRSAEPLEEHIHASSLPVYVLFFAVAGAQIHLSALARMGIPAVILVAVRALGLLSGSRLGAYLAGAPVSVQRYAGYGLLPQAGLALALSMLLVRSFPEIGQDAGSLTLGIVALNELLAPGLFRYALIKSGEGQGAASGSNPDLHAATETA